MSRFLAIAAYDGSGYHGFQKQINGLGIQSVIEQALEKITGQPTPITASGRTDAGVHALGQAFHFDGPETIGARGYYQALNTLLPKDIRIRQIRKVPDDFHARFWALSKRYEYVISKTKDNPFVHRYQTVWKKPVDVKVMRQGASVFLGTHDFTTFSNAQIHPDKPRVKTITRLDIEENERQIRLVFEGNGFLRYQVRMMTGALLALADGKITVQDLKTMLEARDKHACRWNAPAQGLYLVSVGYPSMPEDEIWPKEPLLPLL